MPINTMSTLTSAPADAGPAVRLRARRYGVVALAALIGVTLSALVYVGAASWESRLFTLKLEDLARNHHLTINADLSHAAENVYTLRALMESVDRPVTRGEFLAFAGGLRDRLVGMRSTGWAVRVARDEREAFERAMRQEGHQQFEIWERDADGKRRRAGEREEYFPILYRDPADLIDRVLGFDIASEEARAETLLHARATGRPAATPPIKLVTEPSQTGGFLSFIPVHGRPGSRPAAEGAPAGVIFATFESGRMVESILAAKTRPAGLDIYFFDPRGRVGQRLIYWHSSRTRSTARPAPDEASLLAGPHWLGSLKVADQEWGAIYVPTETLAGGETRWQALASLIGGLIITALVVVYLLLSLKRTTRLEFLTTSLQRTTEELRREAEKVAHLARHDGMTGLCNRASFSEQLERTFAAAKRYGTPFAVLCLDLDHFKDVNDTLGHPSGDQLLQIVAQRLKKIVRDSDLIARLGGDEFAIIALNATSADAVVPLALRIKNALASAYRIDGNQVHGSVSIGISVFKSTTRSAKEMMIQADLALYRSKQAGRNGFYVHTPDLDSDVHQRVLIARELRIAIEQNQLELHYQPQVEVRSGRIVGMEALVRWNHPARGMLSPGVFIPAAETSGMIVALGRWVLEESCRQIQRWRAEGILPPRIGVNFSAAQLKAAPALDRELTELLGRYGVAPHEIEIELTECTLMETTEAHSGLIDRLRGLGVGIAIDDFGTGYSSLEYLRSYRVSRLKIAQEFMRELGTNPGDAAIVRATIGLARELGLEVIAEGVETAEQLDFLDAAGCRHVQGYYFSRPVPAAVAAELMRRGTLAEPRAPTPRRVVLVG